MRSLLILLLALCACTKAPKGTIATTNPNFSVDFLFEHDGCKVYRFFDGGRSRYFSKCQGSVSWTEKHGKSTVDMDVPTSLTDSIP